MIWKTPRKLIEKILFFSGLLSLLLAAGFVWLALSWNDLEEQVRNYDLSIKNQFLVNVQRQLNELENTTDETGQLRIHQKILKLLEGNTNLNHHQYQLSQSHLFIIDHYLKKDQPDLALEAARNYAESQPYLMPAKVRLAEVHYLVDPPAALTELAATAKRFFDVPMIQSAYARLLLKHGETEQAWSVIQRFQPHLKHYLEPAFMFYHADRDRPKYAQQHIIRINHGDYRKTGNRYHASVPLKVNGLSRLRFDLDMLPTGSRVVTLTVSAQLNEQVYRLAHQGSHHLQQLAGDWVTTGSDPYFELSLPEALQDTTEPLILSFDVTLDRKQLNPMDQLFQPGLWTVTGAKGPLDLQPAGNHRYVAKLTSEADQLLIHVPAVAGLKLQKLSILNADGQLIESTVHGVERQTNGWEITTENASLIAAVPAGQLLFLLVEVENGD